MESGSGVLVVLAINRHQGYADPFFFICLKERLYFNHKKHNKGLEPRVWKDEMNVASDFYYSILYTNQINLVSFFQIQNK